MKPLLILFLLFFTIHAHAQDKPMGEPLRQAIWNNDIPEVRRLAAINGPNYFINGLPPLVHAMYANHPEAAQALIDAGANVKWRTPSNHSLAYVAAFNKKADMADFFVTQGGGTVEDAQAGTVEAMKYTAANSVIDEVFKDKVENVTGYRPQEGLKETFQGLSEMIDGHGPQPRMGKPAPPPTTTEPLPELPAPFSRSETAVPWHGERFPATRTRFMTEAEVESWNPAKLRYAINEI